MTEKTDILVKLRQQARKNDKKPAMSKHVGPVRKVLWDLLTFFEVRQTRRLDALLTHQALARDEPGMMPEDMDLSTIKSTRSLVHEANMDSKKQVGDPYV